MIFLKHFSMTKHNKCTKATLANFSKIFPFRTNGQFDTNFARKYATLHIMILHEDFFETRQNDWIQW